MKKILSRVVFIVFSHIKSRKDIQVTEDVLAQSTNEDGLLPPNDEVCNYEGAYMTETRSKS